MLNSVATAAILYGITFAEGVRQLPADAIVLRRLALGRWRFVRCVEIGAGLRLVSWCLPVSLPLVLHRGTSSADEAEIRQRIETMRARWVETRLSVGLLRALGLVTLLLLVGGVPIVVERAGLFGLVVAVIVLLELTFVQALWTGWLLRRLGASGRSAAVASVKLLNPFAVQRAAEVVCARIVADVPALAVAYELLGDEEFVRAFRPMLYDALHGGSADAVAILTPLVAEGHLASLLQTPPPGLAGGAFCPRCESQFARGAGFCSDCDDVPLLVARSE
jgi:hypothetical protein